MLKRTNSGPHGLIARTRCFTAVHGSPSQVEYRRNISLLLYTSDVVGVVATVTGEVDRRNMVNHVHNPTRLEASRLL